MIRSIISVLFISSITVFTTWKLTESYMKRYVDELGVPESVQRMEVGELLAIVSDARNEAPSSDLSPIERITQGSETPPLTQPQGEREEPSVDEQDLASQDEDAMTEQEVSQDDTDDVDGVDDEAIPDAVPVFGTDLVEEESEMLQEFALSTEQFVAMQDQLSTEDKSAIFTILFTKVPQHEFQHLSFILEEGITTEESLEIARILQQYLTEDELQELSSIIQKYE